MMITNNLPWLAAVWLPGLIWTVLAQIDPNDPDHGVRWVYPPRSEQFTFYYKDTVQVQWTSYFDKPLLYTFCSSDSGAKQKSMDYVDGFNGSKAIQLDWTGDDSPCWFNMRPNMSAGYGSNSDQWIYKPSQRAQTTLGAADLSTTSSASAPTSSTTTTSVPQPTTTDAAASAGLSVGAQAGIGVAAGVVGVGLGVLGAIMWLRRHKRRKQAGDSAYAGMPAQCYSGFDYRGNSPHGPLSASDYNSSTVTATPAHAEMEHIPQRQELDSYKPPAELPAMYHER